MTKYLEYPGFNLPYVKEIKQPEGCPKYFRFYFTIGKGGRREYSFGVKAKLTVVVPRGDGSWYSSPIGHEVSILGIHSDGYVWIDFHDHGYARLPASSVEIIDMDSLVLSGEVKELWETYFPEKEAK